MHAFLLVCRLVVADMHPSKHECIHTFVHYAYLIIPAYFHYLKCCIEALSIAPKLSLKVLECTFWELFVLDVRRLFVSCSDLDRSIVILLAACAGWSCILFFAFRWSGACKQRKQLHLMLPVTPREQMQLAKMHLSFQG